MAKQAHSDQATMAEKPEAVAERKLYHEARKRALADCKARYRALTPDNYEEADEYGKERIAFWTEHLRRA